MQACIISKSAGRPFSQTPPIRQICRRVSDLVSGNPLTCESAGGLWHPEASALNLIRSNIDKHPERLKAVLTGEAFASEFFLDLPNKDEESVTREFAGRNGEDALKTAPKVGCLPLCFLPAFSLPARLFVLPAFSFVFVLPAFSFPVGLLIPCRSPHPLLGCLPAFLSSHSPLVASICTSTLYSAFVPPRLPLPPAITGATVCAAARACSPGDRRGYRAWSLD